MGTRFSTGTGDPEKTGVTARNRTAYLPVKQGKPDPEKPEFFNGNRPEIFRLSRKKRACFTDGQALGL